MAPSLSAVCHTQFPLLSAFLLAFLQAGTVPGRPPSLPGPIHESHLCWVPQTPLSPPQTNGVLSKILGHCRQGQIYSLPGMAASGVGSQAREPSVCFTTPCPGSKMGLGTLQPMLAGLTPQSMAQVNRMDLSTAQVTRKDVSHTWIVLSFYRKL